MKPTDGNDATTPSSRKRSLPPPDTNAAPTPTPAKKRKPNGTPKKSDSRTGTLNAISAAISSVFGYGGQSALVDLTGGGVSPGGAQSPAGTPTRRPAIKAAALKGTVWDNSEKPRLLPSGASSPTSAKSAKSTRARRTPASSAAKQRTRTPRGVSVNDSPSKPRSTGQPGSAESAQTSEDDEDEESEDDDELAAGTPSATPSKQVAGKRLWGSAAPSPIPKGILTPSKNRTQTPKTVKFDKRLNGELHFEDLPKTKKTTTPRKPPKEKQPEIVCGICSAPHSKPPNQIILCDNCDYAVHQQCYGVTEIPEGDWLCKSCSQEDIFTSTPKGDTTAMPKAPSRPDDVPDIPNLDRHVRSLQRVLLDRCAGRRRIDMFGLQEVKDKARQIIEQTVVAGEGNSMLLIGARGSGKTTVSANRFEDVPHDSAR